jgi:hypothetical protein
MSNIRFILIAFSTERKGGGSILCSAVLYCTVLTVLDQNRTEVEEQRRCGQGKCMFSAI